MQLFGKVVSFDKCLWVVTLIGFGLILLSHCVARTDPSLTEGDLIRSIRSPGIDWRVEYLLLRGTLTQLHFVGGVCAVLLASGCLLFRERSRRRALAAIVFFGSCSYLLFALKIIK